MTADASEPRISIESREQLLYLLAEAAEIEHSLMCCYLFAAFSLKERLDEGVGADELEAIERWRRATTSVAIEEMTHLALVANLTTALGGAAHFSRPNFPVGAGFYPSGIAVQLAPFDRDTLQHFLPGTPGRLIHSRWRKLCLDHGLRARNRHRKVHAERAGLSHGRSPLSRDRR